MHTEGGEWEKWERGVHINRRILSSRSRLSVVHAEAARLARWLDLERLHGGVPDGLGDAVREALVDGRKYGHY